MSDNEKDDTQPVRPAAADPAAPADPAPAPDPGAAPAGAPVTRRGFRDRLRVARQSPGGRAYGLGALVASALAGVIVGGIGTAAVHAVSDDGPGERGGWVHRPDDDRGPGFGGMRGGPGGVPEQLPPTTPPEDDESGSTS